MRVKHSWIPSASVFEARKGQEKGNVPRQLRLDTGHHGNILAPNQELSLLRATFSAGREALAVRERRMLSRTGKLVSSGVWIPLPANAESGPSAG